MNINDYPRATVILRGYPTHIVDCILETIDDDGLDVAVEVTRNSQNFTDLERQVREHPDVRIGAGTILTLEDARLAVSLGCQFVLSPVALPPAVIDLCHQAEVLVIPGAYTPTEIYAARQAGADIVKLFPIRDLSEHYVRDIEAPLGGTPIMGVGGVTLATMGSLFERGVSYVGIGAALFGRPMQDLEATDIRQALRDLAAAAG